MSWCRIELFGGLRVYVGGRLITRFRTRKTASLLAYLAYHLNRMHPREVLVEMFWGDSEPEKGRNSLSKAVSSLRQQLSFPEGNGSVLYADKFYVGLIPEFVSTDVAHFDAQLKMAHSALSTKERISHLIEAVKVYQGELLPEFYDDWIETEKLRRSEQFEAAVQEIVNFHERTGDLMQALHYARLATKVEPFSEIACERVMRLLLAVGQPAEALCEFQAFSNRLKQRFGQDAKFLSPRLCSLKEQAERQLSQIPQSKKIPLVSTTGSQVRFNLMPCLGTVNLLAVAWQPQSDGQKPLETLMGLVERYGGRVIEVEVNILFSVFPCTRWALECAIACRNQLSWCCVRCFVDTVDLPGKNSLLRTLRQAKELLLNFVRDCQVICSETAAMLIRREGAFSVNLQKAKTLNALNSVSLFSVNVFNLTDNEKGTKLPPLTNRFFGRSEELENLRQWILKEKAQLVSLVGLGGIGKTRLALEFAHRVVNDYQGEVFFVPLQDAEGKTGVSESLVKALGLQLSSEREPLEMAIEALSNRRCLLIWDGFERVLPEELEVLCEVMNRLPKVQNLVTTRCPLGLPQERILPVMPLPFPKNSTGDGNEEGTNLDAIIQFPSVQMFVDRAKAIKTDFNLNERTAGKVAEICSYLEGFPLAIELAASWLSYSSLSQISKRLRHRLDFLQTSRRDIPKRHRNIKSVLTMTWESLPANLKHALACLSVFRGGATIDALQAVAGTESIGEDILQLRNWGLVLAIEQQGCVRRFDLLDTVREFVLRTVGKDEREDLRYRHSKFFVSLAESFADSRGRSGKEWAEWFRRLEVERGNVRAALEWAIENDLQTALLLMDYLRDFWSIQGPLGEAYRWSRLILARVPQHSVDLRAKALALVGFWAIQNGDYEKAQKLCESALSLQEASSDELGQAETHLLLAKIAYLRGDYIIANLHAKLSLDKYQAKGETKGVAYAYSLLGSIAFRKGEIQTAKRHFKQSLKLWSSLGNQLQVEMAKVGLANIAWRQGNFMEAYELYEEALRFWNVVNPEKAAGILCDWGLMALSIGDYERAKKHYETALEIQRKRGDLLRVGAVLNGLASVAWRIGNLDEAQKLLSDALSIFQAIGNRWCVALTLTDLGNLALLRENNKFARSLLSQSLQIWRELGDRWGIANALRKLAVSEARERNFKEALKYLRESLRLCRELGDKLGVAETMEALAEILSQMGNHTLSVRFLSAADSLRIRIGAPLPEVKRKTLTILMGKLCEKLGQFRFEREWEQGRRSNSLPLLRTLNFDHLTSSAATTPIVSSNYRLQQSS